MSDHLPECLVPEMDGLWGLPMHPEDAKANCICPSLRACEQRVLNGAWVAVGNVGVATTTHGDDWRDRDPALVKRDALAAIDALRQECSGNPDTSPSAENEAIDALREDK